MLEKDVGAWVGIFLNSSLTWNRAVAFFPLRHPQRKRIAVCIYFFLEMDEEYNTKSTNCNDSSAGITLVDFCTVV